MEYNKIIAVTGLPGLYELLNSKTDGAIVRSLDDKTTRFVSSRVHNFSHLESIEVYTVRDNVNLVDILKAMEESKDKLPDEKDANALKAYFTKVYPDLDFTRVYSSDLKKMVKWFAVLKANNIEIKLTEPEPEEENGEEVEAENAASAKAEKKKEVAAKVEAASNAPAAKKAEAPVKKAEAAEKKSEATDKKAKPAEKTDKAAAKKAAAKAAPEKSKAEKKTAAKPAAKASDKAKKSGSAKDSASAKASAGKPAGKGKKK